MLKKSFFVLTIVICVVLVSFAQVPQLINYQGMLSDASGTSLSGSYSIEFKIYGAATGGSALWSETQTVAVADGLFDVLLGSVTLIPYSVFDGSDKYLSLKIGSDSEMTPRKRLVSVGYSLRAYDADKLDGKDASDFVQQVDGVSPNNSGNVDLVAGDNVTITPDAANNKITIASSGGAAGDNLGNHTATQNIKLNGKWLSNDGGNEGVYVRTNGWVGVGTSNPGQKFHVDGQIKANDLIVGVKGVYGEFPSKSYGELGTDGCGVYGRSITTTNYGYLGAHNVGAYGQHFSSGNYGSLGKSDCGVYGKGASGYAGKFDGNVYMTGFKMPTGAANGRVLTSDANGTGTWTQMSSGSDNDWTVSGNNMYSAVSGNVGIGITNPAKKLDVREEIQTTSASSSSRHLRIFSADDQRIIATDDLTFRYADGSPSEGALIFKENHTERVRFDKGGKVGIGTSTPGNILTIKQASATDPIADSWTTYSSRRWKTNIKPIDNAISLVKNLTGVSYDWKTGGKSDIGLIAEEVGDVIPEIVAYEENGVDAKSVDYSRLVAVLIQGMKEQQDTIDKLENRIKALENEDR